MATFDLISAAEAQALVTAPRRVVHEEYRRYVRQLDAHTAGRIDLAPDDRPRAIRARLRAAALAEGREIEIQRQDNAIIFWLADPRRAD